MAEASLGSNCRGSDITIVADEGAGGKDLPHAIVALVLPRQQSLGTCQPIRITVVGLLIGRRLREWMTLELRRRRNHNNSQVRSDPHGDQVLGDILAKPYSGVEAFGNDACQPAVDIHLGQDVGMRQERSGQARHLDGFRG